MDNKVTKEQSSSGLVSWLFKGFGRAGKSGRGLPQSTTLARIPGARETRSVLECGGRAGAATPLWGGQGALDCPPILRGRKRRGTALPAAVQDAAEKLLHHFGHAPSIIGLSESCFGSITTCL